MVYQGRGVCEMPFWQWRWRLCLMMTMMDPPEFLVVIDAFITFVVKGKQGCYRREGKFLGEGGRARQ